MADKELTVFLLDAAVPAEAYSYVFDVLAAKLLKGRKTDYVSVATYNSATTSHAYKDTGKFVGIEVLLDFQTASFQNLARLREHLCAAAVLNAHPQAACADVVQTVLFASTLFGPTRGKSFTRNIVLVAPAHDAAPEGSSASLAAVPRYYADYAISLTVVLADGACRLPEASVVGRLRHMFPESTVVPAAEAATLCRQHPAIRKTRPVALYMGDMRLGSDFARVLDDTSYSARTDDSCVAFRVEVHAAARADTHSSDMHEYLVDSDLSIAKVDQTSAHFAWEQGPAPDAKTTDTPPATDTSPVTGAPRKVPVASRSLTPAFKFSNFDLVALDPGLQRAAALQLFSALDVFGFIPERRVSPELLTGEALYVTPDKASSVKNTLGFQAFCDALRTRKLAALCRFVRKQEKEVEVGVAYAVRVKSSLGHTSCFVFVRLPYREDEKIGRFPSLSGPADAAEPQPPAAASLMDAFVNEKTYESDHESSGESASHDAALIDNFKVTMKTGDSSKLPRPPVRKGHDPFICSSPSAARHQAHMRQILLRSLGATDWVRHFENPRFVADNLRGPASSTNFFNLRNCLAVNSQASRPDWLLDLARKSHDSSKRLASELGCTYVRKADSKKAKTQASAAHLRQKGNYGADEGDYDEIPDFGF